MSALCTSSNPVMKVLLAHLVVEVVRKEHKHFRGADVDMGVRQIRADLHLICLAPEVAINDCVLRHWLSRLHLQAS